MAPEDTTSDLPETVSREAHQAMTDKRNSLQAEVDRLTKVVTETSFSDKARKHFADKGVDDPDWAAKIALPNLLSAKTEIGDVGTFLDDEFAKLYPNDTPAPTGEPAPADDGIPVPDASQPPGFARPSPAGDGTPPGQKKYRITDPEVQQHIQNDDMEAFKAMDKAGLIDWRTVAPS